MKKKLEKIILKGKKKEEKKTNIAKNIFNFIYEALCIIKKFSRKRFQQNKYHNIT